MHLPFFYEQQLPQSNTSFTLGEETSKHISQVLRMENGEQLMLTNGKGELLTAEIISVNKKSAEVKILRRDFLPNAAKTTIAISLIKSPGRFEWFAEKATEIGISAIIPLICKRTEKQHFRYERIKSIMISAMLQSQQAWLPLLHDIIKLNDLVETSSYQNKFIAHCDGVTKQHLKKPQAEQTTLIMIGPEGDFTKEEIEMAIQKNFVPVSLGNTRLRTETAGVVAATMLNIT